MRTGWNVMPCSRFALGRAILEAEGCRKNVGRRSRESEASKHPLWRFPNFHWLVVSTPLKILVSWDDYSLYVGKIVQMFQTTNQF